MSTNLMATDYAVSGAGTASVNGTYVSDVEVNGKTSYKYVGDSTYYLFYYSSNWIIYTSTSVMMPNISYYYISSTADTPPSSGWSVGVFGASPAPEVLPPGLSYSPDTFTESSSNDGTIGNNVIITYILPGSDYFTGDNGTFAASKYSASNVPAGLTMVITKNSNLELSVSLTGTATSHTNANDISNLQVAFNNTAFNNADASAVNNSSKDDLNVNFIQQYEVASSGGDYTTITAAIAAADADGGDIINVSAETFTEAALLTVDKDLTIQGQSANATIVQSNATQNTATYGVFQIESGKTVSISNVTIRHGKKTGASVSGGGINNLGTLTVQNSIICNNNVYYSSGLHYGGGIYSSGTITINNCTVSNNVTGASYGNGGGICCSGTATITNSTINGNTAALGAGLYTPSDCTLSITNSTITNNVNNSSTVGGGINAGTTGNVTLKNCTVANNSGGFYANFATLTICNTILADNGTSDYNVASSITLTDNGYNIVENQTYSGSPSNWKFSETTNILYNYKADGSSSTSWNRNNSALENQNLNLSATLADNGGPTQTLALSSGSFVINTIPQDTTGSGGGDTYNGCPSCDQRIYSRPDGSTEPDDNRDIGAYEYGASLLVELSSFTAQRFEDYVLLEWETASEINNAGFHLWRSEAQDGEYLRITEDLIPADGGPTWGAEYEYEDFDAEPGFTYYYKLEDIDYSGTSTFHGPVSATVSDEAILLLSPEDGSYVSDFTPPTFEWDGADLVRFKLRFSTDPTFKKKVIVVPLDQKKRIVWIEEESYTPSPKEWRGISRLGRKGQTVYWRVYGEDEVGEGYTSDVFGFSM